MLQNLGTHLEGEEELMLLKETTAGVPGERNSNQSVITSDTNGPSVASSTLPPNFAVTGYTTARALYISSPVST